MSGGLRKAKIVGATVAVGVLTFYFVAFVYPDTRPALVAIAIIGAAAWIAWRLITRVRVAVLWVAAQKHRRAGDWSAALVSVDKILTIRPSPAEVSVLRLVLLFDLGRDEELLREILKVVSRVHELRESPRRDYLDSYARLLGNAAFVRLHGAEAKVPSQYWYDLKNLSNLRLRSFTRSALPALDPDVLQAS